MTTQPMTEDPTTILKREYHNLREQWFNDLKAHFEYDHWASMEKALKNAQATPAEYVNAADNLIDKIKDCVGRR